MISLLRKKPLTKAEIAQKSNENFAMVSHQFRPNRLKEQSAGAEIAFVVANVEEQFNRAVDAGAIEVVKPAQKPWGNGS